MNFEPQCRTRADLHDHMARVLRMCEAAGFEKPWECARFDSGTFLSLPGMMNGLLYCKPELAEFALAIVEGRPVFRGSEVYEEDGRKLIAVDVCRDIGKGQLKLIDQIGSQHTNAILPPHSLSWNPPQRTIEINGVKVKAPVKLVVEGALNQRIRVDYCTPEDAEAFKAAMEGK